LKFLYDLVSEQLLTQVPAVMNQTPWDRSPWSGHYKNTGYQSP